MPKFKCDILGDFPLNLSRNLTKINYATQFGNLEFFRKVDIFSPIFLNFFRHHIERRGKFFSVHLSYILQCLRQLLKGSGARCWYTQLWRTECARVVVCENGLLKSSGWRKLFFLFSFKETCPSLIDGKRHASKKSQ